MRNQLQQCRDELDAAAAYLLSKRQSVASIAVLMGKTVNEVRLLIAAEDQRDEVEAKLPAADARRLLDTMHKLAADAMKNRRRLTATIDRISEERRRCQALGHAEAAEQLHKIEQPLRAARRGNA